MTDAVQAGVDSVIPFLLVIALSHLVGFILTRDLTNRLDDATNRCRILERDTASLGRRITRLCAQMDRPVPPTYEDMHLSGLFDYGDDPAE